MAQAAVMTGAKIQVSPDRIRAYVVLRPEDAQSPPTATALRDLLLIAKIKITDAVEKRLDALAQQLRKEAKTSEPYLVAEGITPVEPTGQEFIWDGQFKPKNTSSEDDAAVNFYEQHKLVTVTNGTVIGKIAPGRVGKDGLDVHGQVIQPHTHPRPFKLGKYVALDPDGKTVRATSSGQVVLQKDKISVHSVLEVAGNVDFQTGNIDSATDVLIHGSIQDLFIVRSRGQISVKGMVEAAYLFADREITIVGGVKGRGKAILEAKSDVNVKFVNFVYLQAGGDVELGKESIDSVILCDGVLNIPNGSFIGGQGYGMKGAVCKSVGSPAGARTIIGAAFNPLVYKNILDIDHSAKKDKELIQKIRTSVQPLMSQLKRLTPEQREKATELMFRADSLEQEVQQREQLRKQLAESMQVSPEVEVDVSERILPNTQIHIGDKFILLHEEVKGPVKFVLRSVDGVRELVLINRLTGSTRTFISGRLDLETLTVPVKPEVTQPGSKNPEKTSSA